MHADFRCVVLLHHVIFDRDECVALHSVCGSVRKLNASHTFTAGLNQIAFVERELIIGVHPLHRVAFFHLDFAVEIDETCLARRRC